MAEGLRKETAEKVAESLTGKPPVVVTSFEEYLERYAADYYELVEGTLVKMSPVTLKHAALTSFLHLLLSAYFEFNTIGRVIPAPFVMRLTAIDAHREPDLQVILKTNPGQLMQTYMDGPADICIEVVSPESVARDHGKKFEEYEKGKVPEYWIVDPIHRECRFYRLDDSGHYARYTENEQGLYRTPALPNLALHAPTLWQDELPGPLAVIEAVRKMMPSANSAEQKSEAT